MIVRHLLIAAASAALLASSTYGVFADSTGSGASQSGGTVNASSAPGYGSEVTLDAGGAQVAKATNGGSAGAGSFTLGGGIAGEFSLNPTFVTLLNDGPNERFGGGSFAAAGLLTGGYAWANSSSKKHDKPDSSDVSGGPGSGGALYCVVTVRDWTEWKKLARDLQRQIKRCECPTNRFGVNLKKMCPRNPLEIYTAELQ